MGTALVTGASSGFGEEFCWQLAEANHDLVLVARSEDKLREIARKVSASTGVHTEVLVADLATQEGRDKVAERIWAKERPIGLLVNNAGFGLGVRFRENSLENELNALDVMVRAVMELTHAAVRAMFERGHGAVLNVSSVAADTGMGTYSAHKAWVKAFSEGIAEEMRGTGVSVTAVMPGMVNTPFHERVETVPEEVPKISWISSEQVVEEALAAVRRRQVLVTPSVRYKATMFVVKHSPRWMVRAVTSRLPHM
ncbi:MAG: SDR family NAD(P)-dependent oxidoreductase [Actinomycetaceae bacterium]|nr:SDR family NAD(P)-dependent oxidoreductase [Actinomycetaceae bacterium]